MAQDDLARIETARPSSPTARPTSGLSISQIEERLREAGSIEVILEPPIEKHPYSRNPEINEEIRWYGKIAELGLILRRRFGPPRREGTPHFFQTETRTSSPLLSALCA